eukprot:362265-Chlamydomonas_euryale.AAC.15
MEAWRSLRKVPEGEVLLSPTDVKTKHSAFPPPSLSQQGGLLKTSTARNLKCDANAQCNEMHTAHKKR